jgi:hypothetical protein
LSGLSVLQSGHFTVFIEEIYYKRFGKKKPDQIKSIEQLVKIREKKKAERRIRKQQRKEDLIDKKDSPT